MPYQDETWDYWVDVLWKRGRPIWWGFANSEEAVERWNVFKDGRNNAQVANALSVKKSDVDSMDDAFNSLRNLYQYLTDDAPPSGIDHAARLRMFT